MNLHELSATELVAALDARTVSSVEIVTALHTRADAVEGRVRAFTAQHREAALTRAAEADAARARGERWGPLHGLPITLKENLGLAGTPQTVGIRARLHTLATVTSPAVAAALNAGALVLGKTNVPQLLLAMESHNDIWGTTFNPWDLRRAPGGSSGGEAAAIAAGMSPAGIGTDIGGSIRNPAAWCGICGLKPTAGRWSMAAISGGQPGQEAVRAQCGPMARTVDDLILLMRALDPAALHALDPVVPPIPLPDPATVDLRGLRVGVYETDGVFTPAASVRRAVREAAAALAAAGAEVIPWEPPRAWEMFDTYFGLMSADGVITGRTQIGAEPITPQIRSVARLATLPAVVRKTLAAGLGVAGEPRVADDPAHLQPKCGATHVGEWANVAPATTTNIRAPIVAGRAYIAFSTRRARSSGRRTRRSFQRCEQRTDGGGRCSEFMRRVGRRWWSSTGRVGPCMARKAGVSRLKNMP
jgi:fatty acid amide hydrolase